MKAKLVWATPDADKVVGYCARVSNPANQDNDDVTGLLRYCARHGHWSVFEMASACIEINTTRDIARQMLRHRSLSFQEFSQRYADASLLGDMVERDCRMQDTKNRQNSLPCEDKNTAVEWEWAQQEVWSNAIHRYKESIAVGIAKEQARALLPEGLTPSRLYASGTLRSWIHFINVRSDVSTQKEHREIAEAVREILAEVAPVIIGAACRSSESAGG